MTGRRAAPTRRSSTVVGQVVSGPEQAWEVVRDWIVSAGLVPTEERITELLPLARVWSPLPRKVAIGLVAAGKRPTRAVVQAGTRAVIAEKKWVAARRRAEVAEIVTARGPQAAAWVRDYCDAHGHGPSWYELGHALGLDYQHREHAIRTLECQGWISTGRQARSMRPGPRAHQPPPPVPEG